MTSNWWPQALACVYAQPEGCGYHLPLKASSREAQEPCVYAQPEGCGYHL